MNYRKMYKTGEEISTLGYGCMRFPTKNGKIDIEKTTKQILLAIDQGVNYIDTAWFYHFGASESFLGEHILKNGYREKVNIATKLPCYLLKKSSEFYEIFYKQLKKLNVDTIDFYLLHALDGATFKRMLDLGIVDFMNELKNEGRIRYMGFSFHDEFSAFSDILNAYDWDFCQIQYNILDENYQAGTKGLELAYKKGINVFIMEPLRGGGLLGRMPLEVSKIYEKTDKSPVEMSLSFILDRPEVTMLLSGMNEEAHILENAKICSTVLENSLTQDDKNLITEIKNTYDKLLTVKCTGCEYCLPCPAGINIPNAFKTLNDSKMFKNRVGKTTYLLNSAISTKDGKKHYASSCIDCGKCESHCPQHLEIRKHLKEVSKELEPIHAKIFVNFARFYNRIIKK